MRSDPHVVVAGGGWAGVAAAVELADNGVAVTLLESAKQLGGRARRTPYGALDLDNGQHLLIGAYRETLRLLRTMGIEEDHVLQRLPLSLQLHGLSRHLSLRAPSLPAPLHLAWALLRAEGLTFSERASALSLALVLALKRFQLPHDISVAALLQQHKQPQWVVDSLWEPLCLATLNVSIQEASARVFLRVLRDAFSRATRDSDLLLPRTDLGRLFPEPARHFIEQHGGELRLATRVTGLREHNGHIVGVNVGDESIDATHLIMALPAYIAGEMLAVHAPTRELGHSLRSLAQTPITTVYLRYGEEVKLDEPMLGLTGTLSQWVFDRRSCGQPGLIAVVVSGDGAHMAWSRAALASHVAEELKARLGWPDPQESFVVREKRATFHCGPGIDEKRPGNATPLRGLWLAGDYTNTGYPATLEGAARSGVECARLILADLGRQPRGTRR